MPNLTSCVPTDMTRTEFVNHFKDLYEHSPWVAEDVYDSGLSASHLQRDSLHEAFMAVMLGADQTKQLALINAHPDLAGKAAIAGDLTEA